MSEILQPGLLIATSNQGKVREITHVLAGLPLRLRTLNEYPWISPPDECGESYAENAIIKATEYARHTGLWALADDSGLEVDYLAGAPGLKSARFGGPSDADRVELLLSKLSTAQARERRARFVCVEAIVNPAKVVLNVAQRACMGTVATRPAGKGGFGYDPIFIPDGYDLSFAQLPEEVKNRISHRGLALVATREFLSQLSSANLTASQAGS